MVVVVVLLLVRADRLRKCVAGPSRDSYSMNDRYADVQLNECLRLVGSQQL